MNQNSQQPQPAVPGTAAVNRRSATAVRLLAQVTLAAIAVQFVLAGLGAFDAVHGDKVKDSFFTLHDRFALVVIALTVLTLLAAAITRSGRTVVGEAAGLALLAGPLQHELATAGVDHAPWVGSLHVLNGLVILFLECHLAFPTVGSALRKRGASDAEML